MRELQYQHSKGEETTFIEPNKKEEMDDEMNFAKGETNKKDKKK